MFGIVYLHVCFLLSRSLSDRECKPPSTYGNMDEEYSGENARYRKPQDKFLAKNIPVNGISQYTDPR